MSKVLVFSADGGKRAAEAVAEFRKENPRNEYGVRCARQFHPRDVERVDTVVLLGYAPRVAEAYESATFVDGDGKPDGHKVEVIDQSGREPEPKSDSDDDRPKLSELGAEEIKELAKLNDVEYTKKKETVEALEAKDDLVWPDADS